MTTASLVPESPSRLQVPIGKCLVKAPAFFASVSSVKENAPVFDEINFLTSSETELFLISAYDYSGLNQTQKKKADKKIQSARERGAMVLVDSGNYESFWHDDKKWCKSQYYRVLRTLRADAYFSYDDRSNRDARRVVRSTVRGVLEDISNAPNVTIVPIIHMLGPKRASRVRQVVEIAREVHSELVALPERELGDGVGERSLFIRDVLDALHGSGLETRLHILGTGNPLSILAYSVAGADSFDGLEWCRTVVDHRSALLLHFQQYDWLRAQTLYGDGSLPFAVAARAHNLTFMSEWMHLLREARKLGSYQAKFLAEHISNYKESSVSPSVIDLLDQLSTNI